MHVCLCVNVFVLKSSSVYTIFLLCMVPPVVRIALRVGKIDRIRVVIYTYIYNNVKKQVANM